MAEIIFKENNAERRVPIDKDVVIIGRSKDCDLSVSSEAISRKHARVEKREGSYFIEDLGSRNGIYVNNEKTMGSKLKDGDFVKLGLFEFTFRDQAELKDNDDKNATLQQEQKTMMLDDGLEQIILKGIPNSEDTYIEKKAKKESKQVQSEENNAQNNESPSLPDEGKDEIKEREISPAEQANLLIFYDDKAFRAVLNQDHVLAGNSKKADIPIEWEGFYESAFIISRKKRDYYLIDEFQKGEIIYNNSPIIHKRLLDKMIFTVQDVTFQFISNKKGIDSIFEKIDTFFRFLIEKPLIGMLFALLIIILISLVIVLTVI